MKNIFFGICVFILISFSISILSAQIPGNPVLLKTVSDTSLFVSPFNIEQEYTEEETNEEEGNRPDRPDLAREQEVQLTKDPASGLVPQERLQLVFTAIKQQRYQRVQQSLSITAASATWEERGPKNIGGRTRTIMYDPNDLTYKKVWAGGVGGGLWYTNDITVASPVWINVNDFWANIAISCMAYNPANTQEMYVGTGEGWYNSDATRGLGIWKSSDGGNTWAQLAGTNNSTFYQVQKIVVSSTGVIYAATRSGVQRSTTGGSSWTQVLTGRAADLEVGADGTLYASIGIFTTDGIYSSTNGTTWTKKNTGSNGFPLTGFERIEIACAPSDANVLYALTQNDVDNSIYNIYKSVDKGSNWTTQNKPTDADLDITTDFTRKQAWYDLIAAVDPANSAKIIVGGIDLFYSTNSGSNWTQISKWSNNAFLNTLSCSTVHADQHAIVFQPGSSTVFLSGNDGGIYRCANVTTAGSSSQFSNKNTGYNVTQFYACAINPTAGSNNFIAGAQDNGTQKFTATGINATTQATGGDGAFVFIDQTNSNYQISSYVYNNYYRTTNNWSSNSSISSSSTTGSFINPADYDDANGILYSAYSSTQVQRITGIRSSPSSPAQFTVTGMATMATHLRVSPYATAGTTTLFVGTGDGKLFKVTNAQGVSPSTTSIGSASFPNGSISCVEIGASENNLLVTFTNYGVTSVWMTSNGGSSWVSKEGNLPDMPVRWALFNPLNLNEVFLATEVGVWSTSDISVSTPSWIANTTSLANVRVDMLQIRNSDKTIIAATHGRGLFSTNYVGAVAADFTASNTSICTGNSISFTDQTTNNPTSWTWSFPGGTPSTSTLQNPVITYNVAGTYSVTLTAGNSNGTNSTTKTGYITVSSSAAASVSILASPSSSTCSGKNVYFTATPVNGGSNPGYQWKINGTNVGTNNVAYSSTSLTNGDMVTCIMTSNSLCASGSPATSNVITMSVTPSVSVSISISASPSNAICFGTNVTFTATSTNGGTTPVYQWKVNGTNVGTNSTTYSSSTLSNGQVVRCELTSDVVCPTVSPALSNNISMSVTTVTTAGLSIFASPSNTVCSGTNVTFTATPVNGGAGPAFQWKLNGTNVGTNSNTYSNALLLNSDQISCIMTSNATCVLANPATSNTIDMTVNTGPAASTSISASPSTQICPGTNITFTASTNYGGTSPSFQWKLNGISVGTNSSFYSNNSLANNDQVLCTMTSNESCATNNPAMSNTLSITLLPTATAIIGISASPTTTVCAGTNVTFTAFAANTGPAPIYQWKLNGTNVGTNSTNYSNSSLINGSQIRCELTSNATCVTNPTALSNALQITVNPNVTSSINISASPSSLCTGANTTFFATPTNGGSSPSYQWKLNGSNVGINSSSYSNNSLTHGNQIRCDMTSNANCAIGNPVSSNLLTAINCSASLSLKLFIEGFYRGSGIMQAVAEPVLHPEVCDTVIVSIADYNFPDSIFRSTKGILDTSGNGLFTFDEVPPSNYFIVVKHRNAMETWSNTSIPSSPSMMYDFSTDGAKAYGNNQINLGDGNYSLISGDVDQDGIIDLNDLILLEQSIQNLSAGYISADLNGDGVMEAADYSLLENNVGLFILRRP